MALPEEVWGRGPGAPWEYVPNLLSAPALVTSSSLWPLSGSLSTCQSCPLCLSLPISPSVSSTISRLSPSLTSLLFLSVYLPDSPSLSFSSLSFPRLPAFLCLGGLLSLCISLSLSLAVSSLSPPLGVDLCCGIMPSPEGRSGRPAETSADCH